MYILDFATKPFVMAGKVALPQSPYIGMASTITGWYSSRLAYTYGPQYAAERALRQTVQTIGVEWFGEFIGRWIVAPVVVPTLVHRTGWIVGFSVSLITIVALNIIHLLVVKIYHYLQPPPPRQE